MVKIWKQGALPPGSEPPQVAAGVASEAGATPDRDAVPSLREAGAEAGTVSLDNLAPGQSAAISHVVADAGLKLHLLELGFVSGSRITYLMSTPFGDPRIYSLRGTSIALRKGEARCIRVRT